MKKAIGLFGGIIVLTLIFTSCGNDDMLNGAKAHGEDIGKQTCECSKASPDEIQACADELKFLVDNYETFLNTAETEGSDMNELKKAYDEAFEEASKSCE